MIDLIFKFINIGILIALVVYLFKYILGPTIKNKIAQEQLITQNLHEERAQLIAAQKILEADSIEQSNQCKSLKSKIDQWKHVIEKSNHERSEEIHRIRDALESKVVLQRQNYALHKYQQELSSSIVKSLEKELREYFESDERNEQFIESALKKLERARL